MDLTDIRNAHEREMREEKERLALPVTYMELVSESSVSRIGIDLAPETDEQPNSDLLTRLHSKMQQKFET